MTNLTAQELRELLDVAAERSDRAQSVRPAIVASRDPDGVIRALISGGRCSVRGAREQQGVGNAVLTTPPGLAPVRPEPSTAGPGLLRTTSEAPPILWVESLEPSSLERGWSGTVTITGKGFLAVTQFAFLVEDEDLGHVAHPGITIVNTSILDEETAELELEVDAEADLVEDAPLGYSNTGGLP